MSWLFSCNSKSAETPVDFNMMSNNHVPKKIKNVERLVRHIAYLKEESHERSRSPAIVRHKVEDLSDEPDAHSTPIVVYRDIRLSMNGSRNISTN